MKRYGLIGFPLGHSFSREFFTEKFKLAGTSSAFSYSNFPLDKIDQFLDLVNEHSDLVGLNVTIPYKTGIIPFLTSLSTEVMAIGAVNTVAITRDPDGAIKEMIGYNTDSIGFREALLDFIPDVQIKALILGTGGSSKAVQYVLRLLNIPFSTVSRTPGDEQLSYADLTSSITKEHRLIINTTPLGMYPDITSLPLIPYEAITPDHFLFDLIYNPTETAFLSMGKRAGASVSNGLRMLHLQAEASWKIWNPGG